MRLQQGRAPSQGWRRKSKVKMAAGSVSPQASPLGVQGASSSLCPHVAFSLCWCIRGVSLRVHTGQTGLGPPPHAHTQRALLKLNCICRGFISKYSPFQCTEGQALHMCILRGRRSADHTIHGHFPAPPQQHRGSLAGAASLPPFHYVRFGQSTMIRHV